jgi:hypothetical protein
MTPQNSWGQIHYFAAHSITWRARSRLGRWCIRGSSIRPFVWHWIIDPPGVEDEPREEAAWTFSFPQRGGSLPHYGSWSPGYADYLFIGFTTNLAFSPTDPITTYTYCQNAYVVTGEHICRDRHRGAEISVTVLELHQPAATA